MEPTEQNPNADAFAFGPPPVDALGEPQAGVPWYRRGRAYVQTITRAAAAGAVGNDEETTRLLEYGDEQLWPLDRITAEELRDFIAGMHREMEQHVLGLLL